MPDSFGPSSVCPVAQSTSGTLLQGNQLSFLLQETSAGKTEALRAKRPKSEKMALHSPLKLPWTLLTLTALAILVLNTSATEGNWTTKHEAGRCAIRGQCGKQSFFGGELPCSDNELAKEPDKETRQKLVEVCGKSWSKGDVCCDDTQVKLPHSRYLRALADFGLD